jgi:hypothetical protein
MQRSLALLLAAAGFATAAGTSAGATPPFHATLKAYTHTPKVNAKWFYEVDVTSTSGQPLVAAITVQLVDPFGGVHPVEFDVCKRNIVDHPFKGVFADAIEYPPESRGFKVTLRMTVKVGTRKAVLTYWVKPA